MSRIKLISDQDVLALLYAMLLQDGEKLFTFQSAAKASGLSAPGLVQRFSSREAMLVATLRHGWARLETVTAEADAEALMSAKGAQANVETHRDKHHQGEPDDVDR